MSFEHENRQTDRLISRQTGRLEDGHTCMHTDEHPSRQAGWQRDIHADRLTDRGATARQTSRQADTRWLMKIQVSRQTHAGTDGHFRV